MHWFCLTYLGESLEYDNIICASITVGREVRFVRHADINELREKAGVDKNAVLISCSYLGECSKEVFLGEAA